jgi:Tol biopolymer transport system component
MAAALRAVRGVLPAASSMNPNSTLQEYFVAGGTLWGEAPSYIVRPADEELYRLAFSGEYCNVLAARQMGKSSLMVRTANRLRGAGVRAAILDISTLGAGISTPEAWFFGFLDELGNQLGLDEDIDAWWETHRNQNPVQRFSSFLRDVVLQEIPQPIVVFVDEIDSALGMNFTDDFFAAIRAAYNARASQPEYQRLTFILQGVARPADLIRDRNRTPYNIGTHIHLSDFTLPELLPYQDVFEAVYPGQGQAIIGWVLDWTNGQPYLTQKLCSALIRTSDNPCSAERVAQTVDRLFFTEEARKESNLRAIRDRIESSPHKTKLLQIYGQILSGKPVVDEMRSSAKVELKLTGLVRSSAEGGDQHGRLEVHNRIYRTVFNQDWVQKNLPQTRTRQVAILASLLAILAFVIAGYALYRQQIQPSQTYAEQFQNSLSPDVRLTSLARLLEIDAHPDAQAHELYTGLSQPEKLDLFTGLSSPQNVAPEVVTVIEATYQDNQNTAAEDKILSAMETVLGQIGAAGAPSLKTEIGFWLKGREEANQEDHAQTAVSFYDSAWAESVKRGHPNYAVRLDRARALIALGAYEAAFEDLQAVWEQDPARQAQIEEVIQANPPLGTFFLTNPTANPEILAHIIPLRPTATTMLAAVPSVTPLSLPSPTLVPSPTDLPTATSTQPSPFTGWITYAFGVGTEREIHLLNPVTGAQPQVTFNGVIDETPSFSPDNWQLIYASNRSQDGWEIYSFDLHRGTEQQLTAFAGQARFPVWSPVPGDTRIVFEGITFEPGNPMNIWMFDTASGEFEQLTTSGADFRPIWSPDGKQIAFGRALADTTGDGRITVNDIADLFILDLATGKTQNLTNTPEFDDFNFAWSPDGEQIAFTSVRQDANGDGVLNLDDSQDLFLIRPDGSGEQRLDLGGRAVYSPSWSPDGRFIAVRVAKPDGQNAIWRYDTQTKKFINLTGLGPYYQPSYSQAP